MPLDSAKNPGHGNNTRQRWESLVEQLRKTDDLQRIKELVIHLEEAVFNRQQKLVLNAAKLDKCDIQEEEQRLKQALDLMLEMKVKKLGFPEIRKSAQLHFFQAKVLPGDASQLASAYVGGKMKSILLADDNPYILDTLAARLRNNATEVITATNGQQAVDAGIRTPPDLAILDVSMPVMSGLEAAERLHKLLPRLPIILYTSYADLLKSRMHELGVVAVFDKSSSLRELLNTVDECLDRKAA